jgi:hypothetical protein
MDLPIPATQDSSLRTPYVSRGAADGCGDRDVPALWVGAELEADLDGASVPAGDPDAAELAGPTTVAGGRDGDGDAALAGDMGDTTSCCRSAAESSCRCCDFGVAGDTSGGAASGAMPPGEEGDAAER